MPNQRPTLSCKRCRERRVRCDKARPCTACIRNHTADMCVYDKQKGVYNNMGESTFQVFKLDSDTNSNIDSTEIIKGDTVYEILKKVNGNNRLASRSETINFSKRNTSPLKDEPSVIGYCPLSWIFIERKDHGLHFLLSHYQSANEGTTANDSKDDHISEDESVEGLFYTYPSSFRRKIEEILPNREVVWGAVSLFFKTTYTFMPFLDEISFRNDLSRILGSEEISEQKIVLTTSNNDDFTKLGILLILIRIAYVVNVFQHDTYALASLETDDSVRMANLCLKYCQLKDSMSLSYLQFALFMRMYQRVAPEVGEGIYDSKTRIQTGMLIQIAYSLGLNREPTLLDGREANLRRKIWHFLVVLDLSDAISYRPPLISNDIFYNTRPCSSKYIDQNNSNNSDYLFERAIAGMLENSSAFIGLLREMVNMSLDIKGSTKISKLIYSVNSIERFAIDKIGFLLDFNKPLADDFSLIDMCFKSQTFKVILSIKSSIIVILLHLAAHFESSKTTDLMLFYHKKIQCITICEILPVMSFISDNWERSLGSMGVFISNAFFFQVNHVACLVNISMLVRMKFHLINFKTLYRNSDDNATIFSLLEKGISGLLKCLETSMQFMSRLSKRFNQVGKTLKLAENYLTVFRTNEYYKESNFEQLGKVKYTVNYLQQVNYIYDATLRFESSAHSTPESLDFLNPENFDYGEIINLNEFDTDYMKDFADSPDICFESLFSN